MALEVFVMAMIFLNFKTYRSGTAEQALRLVQLCQKFGGQHFIPVLQAVDLYRVSRQVSLPLWAQSADASQPYKNSGHITPYALKQSGATGFFINHSDCPKSLAEIKQLISIARQLQLKTLVFAASEDQIREFDHLEPDFTALEDPRLIASQTAMVDKYEELLKKLALSLKAAFIIGAGIRTKEHYQKALKLGAKGVVISSQVMESQNPEQAITSLLTSSA